jgi:hypothetical protein
MTNARRTVGRLLLLLLISSLAVGGLTACMGEDDDGSAREERRVGALDPTQTDPGGDLTEPGGNPPPPPPPTPPPCSGTSVACVFRGSAGLAQPPLGRRVAIAGILPPGRYVLFAKINMASIVGGTISSHNSCDLKGDTATADDVVLDWTVTTHSGTGVSWAATVLSATHQVTSSGEVKVVCFNGTGGTIGSRVLTAHKVGT